MGTIAEGAVHARFIGGKSKFVVEVEKRRDSF
jgi:hypothetical protein